MPGASGAFDRHRPLLFSKAYRMLGSVMEAEDAVQEAYLRWRRASREEVLLESLTPVERAVFLLRKVFGYEYVEIAGIVGKSEANC